MKALYRISDNGYVKEKFEFATKMACLENFMLQWPLDEIVVFVDKVIPETQKKLDALQEISGLQMLHIQGGSSAGSWRIVRDYALALEDTETVYFVEDDYCHRDGSRRALEEALARADYATLYDAPDKYIPASKGGNPFIDQTGSDETRVILTKSSHWRLTNSTTMTFACKVGTLREDNDIWTKHTSGTHPHDFPCFIELRAKGRTLVSPIPSLSTHCEPMWAAPLIDWKREFEL